MIRNGYTIFPKHQNTTDCQFALRISKQDVERLRKHFNTDCLKFKTCELLDQGRGWYLAVGDDIHVNGALRVLDHLDFVRKYSPDADHRSLHVLVNLAVTLPKIRQVVAKTKPRRIIVCKPLVRPLPGIRVIAKDRAIQALSVRALQPRHLIEAERERIHAEHSARVAAELAALIPPNTAMGQAFAAVMK